MFSEILQLQIFFTRFFTRQETFELIMNRISQAVNIIDSYLNTVLNPLAPMTHLGSFTLE